MFDSLKNKETIVKSPDSPTQSINLIGAGTVIEGEVKSNGDIRIDGTIVGSVSSKAKVVIGNSGVINGDVVCQNADISGTVKGKTSVSELLFLKSSARINGDIVTGKLVVEAGASFTGSCNMGPMIKEIKLGEQHQQQGNQFKEKSA